MIDRSGFSIEEGVLAESECEQMVNALSNGSLKRSRAGARHLMSHPAVAALASDRRLLAMARRVSSWRILPMPIRRSDWNCQVLICELK